MCDILNSVALLRRPKTLVRAAQFAKSSYRRNVHLPRLLACSSVPAGTACVTQLIDLEHELDQLRRNRDASYNSARHINALAALLSESDALRAATIFEASRLSSGKGASETMSRSPLQHRKARQDRLNLSSRV